MSDIPPRSREEWRAFEAADPDGYDREHRIVWEKKAKIYVSRSKILFCFPSLDKLTLTSHIFCFFFLSKRKLEILYPPQEPTVGPSSSHGNAPTFFKNEPTVGSTSSSSSDMDTSESFENVIVPPESFENVVVPLESNKEDFLVVAATRDDDEVGSTSSSDMETSESTVSNVAPTNGIVPLEDNVNDLLFDADAASPDDEDDSGRPPEDVPLEPNMHSVIYGPTATATATTGPSSDQESLDDDDSAFVYDDVNSGHIFNDNQRAVNLSRDFDDDAMESKFQDSPTQDPHCNKRDTASDSDDFKTPAKSDRETAMLREELALSRKQTQRYQSLFTVAGIENDRLEKELAKTTCKYEGAKRLLGTYSGVVDQLKTKLFKAKDEEARFSKKLTSATSELQHAKNAIKLLQSNNESPRAKGVKRSRRSSF